MSCGLLLMSSSKVILASCEAKTMASAETNAIAPVSNHCGGATSKSQWMERDLTDLSQELKALELEELTLLKHLEVRQKAALVEQLRQRIAHDYLDGPGTISDIQTDPCGTVFRRQSGGSAAFGKRRSVRKVNIMYSCGGI